MQIGVKMVEVGDIDDLDSMNFHNMVYFFQDELRLYMGGKTKLTAIFNYRQIKRLKNLKILGARLEFKRKKSWQGGTKVTVVLPRAWKILLGKFENLGFQFIKGALGWVASNPP